MSQRRLGDRADEESANTTPAVTTHDYEVELVLFETFLDALPGIGSVCSGGRYDNLAELYTNQELPGVGASLGLDRLLAAMEELGMIEKVATPAPVFIDLR